MAAITDLSTASSVAAADYLVLSQSGTDKKVTANKFGIVDNGVWTPDLRFGGSNAGITYSNRQGYYSKIGRIVLVQGSMLLSSKGSPTGNATVAGLPFASTNVSLGVGEFICRWFGMSSSLVTMMVELAANSSEGTFLGATAATTGLSVLTDTAFGASSILYINGFYFAVA